MPICKSCSNHFSSRAVIDGQVKKLSNRTHCLACSPFGCHNTKKKRVNAEIGEIVTCGTCRREFVASRSAGHRGESCNTCVQRRRRDLVASLVIGVLGSACWICGYSRSKQALHAHHRIPSNKEFSIGGSENLSIKRISAELAKCALLCANCHSEVHDGLIGCPDMPLHTPEVAGS